MEAQKVPCMNTRGPETSYANKSLLQKRMILLTKPIIQESITELLCSSSSSSSSFPESIKMANMGCSSGPNTFLPIWNIIESIDNTCHRLNRKPPMLQVFLNDLPENDFNSVFKSLPGFYEKLEREKGEKGENKCSVAATPGSIYGRLFPDNSLHFVYSSYSLHWFSQVPKELVSETGIALNKGNVLIAKTSPPAVHKAYLNQYEKDFTTFLKFRSQEMKPGGRMILTFMGRNENDYSSEKNAPFLWELIGITLNEMVMEGLIEESKLDTFNVPLYAPSAEEVRQVIETEGSFIIHRLETFQRNNSDANIDDDVNSAGLVFNKYSRAKSVAKRSRAIGESVLAGHFGDVVVDNLFHRFIEKVANNLGKGYYTNLLLSLTKECKQE